MGRPGALAPLLVLAACGLAAVARAGPLMAVDFGGESVRVSVVKPGRSPISVVLNEASKRKTAALVGFLNGDRLLGEEAATAAARHPDKVFARARELLGRRADDPALLDSFAATRLPYRIVPASPERPAAALRTEAGDVFSAEELVASLLHYARKLTQAAADGAAVLDCVITVPAFWGPAQRQALIDAARLAGVNVLSLLNSHAAAALQYGMERDFSNSTETVALVDMGALSTEAALLRFSSFRVREGGSLKTYGQVEVLDVAWDASLGGEAFDLLLLERFADEFAAAHPGLDPRHSPKATAKLRRAAKRCKEVLSANSFAPVSVEELMEGLDFRTRVERSEFEALAAPLLARAAGPLRQVLSRTGTAPEQLTAVELLGGGTRVPAVKAALSGALGGRQLDMHLDADEATVLGAGLFAANRSTTFRLRKFGLADGITYPLSLQLDAPEGAAVDEASAKHFAPKPLLPRMKRLPARRVVPLPALAGADSLTARLAFNTSDPTVGLPPGVASPALARYTVSGLQEALAKHNGSGKPSLTLRADESGLVAAEKAEAAVEVIETYTVRLPKPPPAGSNGSQPQAQPEAAAGAAASDAAAAAAPAPAPAPAPEAETEEVTRTRQRTLRLPLAVGGPGLLAPGLTPAQLEASAKVLARLAAREAAKAAASEAKNALEAYVIRLRGRLADDAEIAAVSSEQQRADLLAKLEAAEEWLYEEAEDGAAAPFEGKLASLRQEGDPLELRASERTALPKALKNAADFAGVARQAAGGWRSTKPWLNATEVEALRKQIDELEAWSKAAAAQQARAKPTDAPALLSAAVDTRVAEVRRAFERLKGRKKPRPPPAPKSGKAKGGEGEAPAAAPAPAPAPGPGEGAQQEAHDEL